MKMEVSRQNHDPASPLEILFEDAHLIVLNKPAGLATTGVPEHQPSLHRRTVAYLQRAEDNAPFLGCVSRLDVPVGGIVLMAKTTAAAHHLSLQYRERRVRKTYHALVSGCVKSMQGTLRHWLVKRGIHSKVRCVPQDTPGAQQAELSYRVLRAHPQATELEIDLHTGRKHQIRTQLSRIGHPIWGDFKYGSRLTLPRGIALLAKELRFVHPDSGDPMEFQVDYPATWPYDIETLAQQDRTWLGRIQKTDP